MKNTYLLILFIVATITNSFAQGDCTTPENITPICIGTTQTFAAGVDQPNPTSGNNYDCLGSQPNPRWFYFEIENPGSLVINQTNLGTDGGVDVDGAIYGPFTSLAEIISQCGDYPQPLDCDYAAGDTFTFTLNNVQNGEFYLLLVTNFSNANTEITLADTGSTATTNCSRLLPIELIDFNVEVQNESNLITWSTATETNNDYFEVERSEDGIDFETIARVNGAGTTFETQNYSYNDYQLCGTAYYRLKQVDYDLKYTYSDVIETKVKCENDFIVSPNPFTESVQIRLKNTYNGNATIQLSNTSGQVIYSQKQKVHKGINNIFINSLPNDVKGIMLLEIFDDSNKRILTKKLVKH